MRKEKVLIRVRRRWELYLIFFGLFVMCIYFTGFSEPADEVLSGPLIVNREEGGFKLDDRKHILLFSDTSWYIPPVISEKYFEDNHCPVTSCVITTNHSYLPNLLHYDALVFWAHDKWPQFEYPNIRSPEQIYVMAMLESPFHVRKTFEQDSKLINWTMSYRIDSDVIWTYGHFQDKENHRIISPKVSPNWRPITEDQFFRPFFKDPQLLKLVHEKTKHVAWFVSNCNTPSKRMEVVESLRKFIPVDIYGNCGDKSCPRDNETHCRMMVEQDYKFYLGFENSLCADYVTEKVFSNMNYYIIPVVYGGANYTRFLPPRSYINVQDFKSTKALADYLWYLSLHPEEYIKYFWWKEYYYISSLSYCDLCVKMHQTKRLYKTQYYTDIDSWYRKGVCQSGIPIELSNA